MRSRCAVAIDSWAQHRHVAAARLKSGRRGGDPHQPTARLQHVIGAHLHLTADCIEDDVARRCCPSEILLVVVDHVVGAEHADVLVISGTRGGDHRIALMVSSS
jgi:hypothetical protein